MAFLPRFFLLESFQILVQLFNYVVLSLASRSCEALFGFYPVDLHSFLEHSLGKPPERRDVSQALLVEEQLLLRQALLEWSDEFHLVSRVRLQEDDEEGVRLLLQFEIEMFLTIQSQPDLH
jgi:hypothetical protein